MNHFPDQERPWIIPSVELISEVPFSCLGWDVQGDPTHLGGAAQCPPDTADPRRVRWALPSETPENCCYSSSYTVPKRSVTLDSMKFTFYTLNLTFLLIILWVYSHSNLEPSSQRPLATWQASARYGEAFLSLQRSSSADNFCVDHTQTSAESWSFSEKPLRM